MQASGAPTIFGLQGLRFLAAGMVVVTHALNRTVVLYPNGPLPRQTFLEAGVDIFFVISGFIMVYILKPGTSPGTFWIRRFTRIVPLYWLFTILAFVGGYVVPRYFFGAVDWRFGLLSLSFMPLGNQMWPHPLLSPGWTLNYEFAFYTIFALCMFFGKRLFFAVTLVIILIVTIGTVNAKGIMWAGYYSDGAMMLEFLFGMAAAALVKDRLMPPLAGVGLAVIGLVLIYYLWNMDIAYPRGLKIGMPAFLVVVGILVSEPIWQKSGLLQQFARLGDASYAIYIVHYLLVQAIATFFEDQLWARGLVGPYGFTILVVVVGIGAGLAAHVLIEKPLLRVIRTGMAPTAAASPAAAVKV